MEIRVVENALKFNDEFARQNREMLRSAGVGCVNVIGSPGCGKTTLLEAALERLRPAVRVGVIAGDIATTRDAERLGKLADQVTQINTGGSCHLDANQVRLGLGELDLGSLDLVIVENVGNLICPVGFDLGEGAKVGLFSVPEGDDKPAKHPRIVLEADLLVLTKTDLEPHVPFDRAAFERDVRLIREDAPLMTTSARTGEGIEAWCGWLSRAAEYDSATSAPRVT